MSARIDDITIVGGGTAGWLTALILQSFLNRRPDQPPVTVTLIESPTIPTIGVGEATVRGITNLFRQLGINERDFMRRCNATFKLAAEFEGWNLDAEGKPVGFLHPFNFPNPLDGINPAYHFLRYGSINGKKAAEALTWNQAVINHRKGPRPLGGKDYEAVVAYAYHLDAALFGPFLRETATERGVIRIEDDVKGGTVDERGHVTSLELERHGTHPVKLVIDCTGFRSVIMQDLLGEPFESYGQHLLCDRAMPCQIPVPQDRPLPCATRATGMTGGWVFRVPLAERIGTGYIYSSAHKSDDEARAELIAHLRKVGDVTPEMADPEPKVIKMKTGRTQRAWVGNCVAIGLSNGFVEPLEATAIYMVESATRWLINYFPDEGIDPALPSAFNRRMDSLYDEIRDFLSMHFVTSNRPEPFWQAARAPGVAPARLQEVLDLWKATLPSDQDMFYKGLFGEWNYLFCLWEKGYFDQAEYPLSTLATPESWERFQQGLNKTTQDLLRALPDHRQLLNEMRGEAQLEAVQPAANQPVFGRAMQNVAGDGAWQAAQPLYQAPQPQAAPAAPPPAPATDLAAQPAWAHYGKPASVPQPAAQLYPETPSAPPAPSMTYGTPAAPSISYGGPSFTATPAAAPPNAPPSYSGGAGSFAPAPPAPSFGGPTFAAPAFGAPAAPEPQQAAPTATPGFSAGASFDPAAFGQTPAAAETPQAPEKPGPSPFAKSLAKRYGKKATVNAPR
ncbi:MAG: FAD-dependent oxidoreductase [Pseudomonadota bacterium]